MIGQLGQGPNKLYRTTLLCRLKRPNFSWICNTTPLAGTRKPDANWHKCNATEPEQMISEEGMACKDNTPLVLMYRQYSDLLKDPVTVQRGQKYVGKTKAA